MSIRKRIVGVLTASVYLVPVVSFAETNTILGIAQTIHNDIYNNVIMVLLGSALVLFLWGVTRYIGRGGAGGDKASKDSHGVGMMSYGLLVLFVAVGVWGLLSILVEALDFTQSSDFGLK